MSLIHLFQDAKDLNNGDILQARVDSVEGRRRVILEVIGKKCPECLNGWKRDVETEKGEYIGDIECNNCQGTGVIRT